MPDLIDFSKATTGSAEWWLPRLERRLIARQADMKLFDDYYHGRHRMTYHTARVLGAFGATFRDLRVNYCGVVVDALNERLEVQGFRLGRDQAAADAAWDIWQRNRLDALFARGSRSGLTKGEFSLSVWVTSAGEPRIAVEDGGEVYVATNPGDPHDRRAAIKRWYDEDERRLYAIVYLADGIYWFRSSQMDAPIGAQLGDLPSGFGRGGGAGTKTSDPASVGSVTWERYIVADAPWPLPNPIGVVPVVPLPNRPDIFGVGESELAAIRPIQDAINANIVNVMLAGQFAAFRQKYASNVRLEIDPDTGQPKEPWKVDISTVMTAPPPENDEPEVKFGEFEQTDMSGYIALHEGFVQGMATISRTPPHYFLGQALALDTLVPTPIGFRTMGDLAPGDEVYDERGDPQVVEKAYPVLVGEPCYRVLFDDGSEVIADADHKWVTSHYTKRRAGRDVSRETTVVTTREIAETLVVRGGQGWSAHHYVPVTAPLLGRDVDLPIDPYMLGVWLGDGDSRAGTITQSVTDADALSELLVAVGERVDNREETDKPTIRRLHIRKPVPGRCIRGHDRALGVHNCAACERDRRASSLGPITNATLTRRLRALSLLHAKAIPEIYMQAPPAARLALLQGLMDTDGHAGANGQVEFTQASETIARDVLRLAASLGHKPTLRSRPTLHQRQYRVTWSAPEPVFRLPRKVAAQRIARVTEHGLSAGPFRRYIVACEPVESEPVRCIRVSGPSHQFLVTEACIATHNSGTFPSGESLRSAEAGLTFKARDRIRDDSEPVEEAMMLAFRMKSLQQGMTPRAAARFALWAARTDSEALWRDPETKTESEHVDALVKLGSINVPQEVLWSKIPATPQEVQLWKSMQPSAQPVPPSTPEMPIPPLEGV